MNALARSFCLALSFFICGAELRGADAVFPAETWRRASPADVDLDRALLEKARDYALTGGGSGYVTRHGKLVMAWGDIEKKYDLKSTSKSIGVTALGLAIADGKIALSDRARKHHPTLGVPPKENSEDRLEKITIQHLATQTAGFEKRGGYERLAFEPGTRWLYSDGGPNWLAECVTLVYQRDISELLFERVFTPIGIRAKDLHWRKHAYRPAKIGAITNREFGSGVHANVDAMARIGYLYLRRGKWSDRRLLTTDFVDTATTTVKEVVGLPEHGENFNTGLDNASDHYGLLWWNNADGSLKNVPRDTYWSWGLYDSLIVVIPDLDIVVSRAGRSWKREAGAEHYDVLRPFFEPIVRAAKPKSAAPYPRSSVIRRVIWSDKIVRRASGSDNFPLAWADDDALYTAYGDGRGFQSSVPKKLSMGFAKVVGGPDAFRGSNIRTPTGETSGGGASGKKASGLIMIDGTLYLLARNAGNSRLAWSRDHAKTWTWSDWKFDISFGCPTFLSFSKNYAGARDRYVYIYSLDSDSAYEAVDRMVLARVPKSRLREREAYEFFVELKDGQPRWTKEIAERGAVFRHEGRCYRSGVSYNTALKRYLWCQTHKESTDSRGPRFQGGFGIYDAPEPWGPWTTVYFAHPWDVGPGETSSLPPKWMSADGKTMHLVFSGDDHFSVRKVSLEIATGH